MQRSDLVVVGTDAGGGGVATRCARAGWRVVVVDDEPYGGTCLLRGCDPKKVLVGVSELVDSSRRMSGHGVDGDARMDWSALMAFKYTFTDPVPQQQQTSLEKLGVTTHHGVGRFTAPDRFLVNDTEIESRFFVIASGARPAPLGIPGAELVKTSTDFLELNSLSASHHVDRCELYRVRVRSHCGPSRQQGDNLRPWPRSQAIRC